MRIVEHAQAVYVLGQPARFSSACGTGIRALSPGGPWPTLNLCDPPQHTCLRSQWQAWYEPRARRVLPRLEGWAQTLVERSRGELVSEVAAPLAWRSLAELLELPVEARNRLPELLRELTLASGRAGYLAAEASLQAYLRARPGLADGLPGEGIFGLRLLLLAGWASTMAALGSALRLWCEHGEAEVDEVLRWEPPLLGFGRQVTGSAERVFVDFVQVNRDPQVFRHPEVYDPKRHPNPHLAFGWGPHRCLGESLARAQLRAVLRAARARGRARLVDWSPLPSKFTRGPARLEVEWAAGAPSRASPPRRWPAPGARPECPAGGRSGP